MHVFVVIAILAAAASTTAKKPNIVFILADDLNYDLVLKHRQDMPNLMKYFVNQGVEFSNHVAAAPVCGPSRSSFLAGRYPHNTGYVKNAALPSIDAFSQIQNHTVGRWLTDAGYYTAFLGKYVNGMECDIPSGWRHWGGLTCGNLQTPKAGYPAHSRLGGTYNYYNSSQWSADFGPDGTTLIGEEKLIIHTGDHQSNFLAKQAAEQALLALKEDKPFFLHLTPLMVHYGTCYGPQPMKDYAPTDPFFEQFLHDPKPIFKNTTRKILISPCPSTKRAHSYDRDVAPRYPSYNKTETGDVPDFIKQRSSQGTSHECCDTFAGQRQDVGFRNRSSALLDLDDLFGTVISNIQKMGQLESTYIIFSSDNGYHLGEHRLLFGKSEPYETDIRLPMFVRGPGITGGTQVAFPTNHMDITATIVAWAEAKPDVALDGLSFVPALVPNPPPISTWRQFSFTEFYVDSNTWWAIRFINETTSQREFTYHRWCSNQTEVFGTTDAFELFNSADSAYGQRIAQEWLPKAATLGSCSGASCHVPSPAHLADGENPLPCRENVPMLDAEETFLDP